MAATGNIGHRSFSPDHAAIFDEIFADGDSDGEFDFDGFSDVQENEENDGNDDDTDRYVFDSSNWDAGDRNPDPLAFDTIPGINTALPDNPSPLRYLQRFISDEDYEEIAEQTNLYADRYLQMHLNSLKPTSRFRKWTPTSGCEIQLYIAISLAMGLIHQLDVQEYWSTDPVTSTPFFPSVISRDRFLLLTSFFHLNDNSSMVPRGSVEYQPLHKLGPVFSRIISRFAAAYTPHKQLSFDEGMVPWRGNLSFRVYNPDKPSKFGIKMYMLCDATNAYCLKVNIYTGKDQRLTPSNYGATYDLVMNMLRGYFGQGHILYCDRYFSSPQLFWDLWQLGVGATGTVTKQRRGIPQELKDAQVPNKGDVAVMHNGSLAATKYRDHKDVYMLSTVHQSHNVQTNKRDPVTGAIISKPSVVHEYNKYMGGVDRADQMVAYNHPMGTLKWWKKVFFHVLNLAVLNAYLLYKETTSDPTPMLQRIFRKKLVSEMVTSAEVTYSSRKGGRPAAERLQRLHGHHFPGKGPNRNCIVCNNASLAASVPGEKRKRTGRQTTYICKNCNIPLCIIPCFELYHSKQEYVAAYKRWKQANAEERKFDVHEHAVTLFLVFINDCCNGNQMINSI